MAGQRFMTRAQFRNRYAGLRGTLRFWADFVDDLRDARDIRRRRKLPRVRHWPAAPTFLPGQIIPVTHDMARNIAAQQQAVYGLSSLQNQSPLAGLNGSGLGGLMGGMQQAGSYNRWPF